MKLATFFAAAILMVGSSLATAQEVRDTLDDSPSAGAMAIDLLVVRPISLVGSVLSIGLFVIQLPLAIPQGEWPSETARRLVAEPVKFTFTRRLGSMEYTTVR